MIFQFAHSTEVYANGADIPKDPKLQIFDESSTSVSIHDCKLFVRHLNSNKSTNENAPRVIAINGVPVSSWVYRDFAIRIAKMGWSIDLLDLPGTGHSTLEAPTRWGKQRACIEQYLKAVPQNYILILHDISGPIVLPFIDELPKLRGLFVLNSVIKTYGFKPIAPMSTLRKHFLGDLTILFMGREKYKNEIKKIGLKKDVDDYWLDQILTDMREGDSIGRLTTIMRSFDSSKLLDSKIAKNIASFEGPKFAVWGLADPSLGNLSYYAKGVFGETNYLEIPDAKHFFMMDFSSELAKIFDQVFTKLK